MEFIDRKIKCKKIQKTDYSGSPLPEAFYALIEDEVTQEGTPLDAVTMNKLSVNIDAYDELNSLRDATTGQISPLQDILYNSFNVHTRPCRAYEYDNKGLTAIDYDSMNIKAFDYDICGQLKVAGVTQNAVGYGLFELRDPTTGQKNFLQNIINNIFNLMTEPFTTQDYSDLEITALQYDNKNITAINYDMRGKTQLQN